MYSFSIPNENDGQKWVWEHPSYPQYGLAIKVIDLNVEANLVFGNIDGETKLEVKEDHSVPIPVQLWFFLALSQIKDLEKSVNSEGIQDLKQLLSSPLTEY